MSDLRAYVSGESLWSKAQKEAIHSLSIYARTGEIEHYRAFSDYLRIPEGDRRARLEMDRATPNAGIIKAGFTAGGINPLDIDGMYWLYRHLKWLPDVQRAVGFWQAGDNYIFQLRQVGEHLHDAISNGNQASASAVALNDIYRINSALIPIEEGFSNALGDLSRLTYRVLVNGIGAIAILLIVLGFTVIRLLQARSSQLLERLRVSEERLTLGFQGSNAGMWDWDIRNRKVYYSSWIERTLGFAPADLTSSTDDFIALIHPDDRAATLALANEHFLRGTPYRTEFRLKRNDGTYLWCRSRGEAVRDADGTALRMVGSLIDITDLKIAEELGAYVTGGEAVDAKSTDGARIFRL